MPSVFKTSRRVEFCETDAAGLAHFSSFFTMMEQAEHAFLRSLGWSVVWRDDEGVISWPRVSCSCQYQGAARFEDVLDVELRIRRQGEKSVTYNFAFTCDSRDVAAGSITAVCCRIQPDEPPQSIAIPEALAEKLRPYVVAQPSGEQ